MHSGYFWFCLLKVPNWISPELADIVSFTVPAVAKGTELRGGPTRNDRTPWMRVTVTTGLFLIHGFFYKRTEVAFSRETVACLQEEAVTRVLIPMLNSAKPEHRPEWEYLEDSFFRQSPMNDNSSPPL